MTDRLAKLLTLAEIDPSDAELLYSLAMEYQRMGEHADAITSFDRAIAADANLLYAYYHKARSQTSAGDAAGAKETLQIGRQRAASVRDDKAKSEIEQLLRTIE